MSLDAVNSYLGGLGTPRQAHLEGLWYVPRRSGLCFCPSMSIIWTVRLLDLRCFKSNWCMGGGQG